MNSKMSPEQKLLVSLISNTWVIYTCYFPKALLNKKKKMLDYFSFLSQALILYVWTQNEACFGWSFFSSWQILVFV